MVITLPLGTVPPINDMSKLRNAVTDMDALAQGGFKEIAAIAHMAMLAMQHPMVARHPEPLAQALSAIKRTADDIVNCINATAEEVGCHWSDPALDARRAAQRTGRIDAPPAHANTDH